MLLFTSNLWSLSLMGVAIVMKYVANYSQKRIIIKASNTVLTVNMIAKDVLPAVHYYNKTEHFSFNFKPHDFFTN